MNNFRYYKDIPFSIFTATVVEASPSTKPIASALTTRPKAPWPNVLPSCKWI